MSGPRSKEFLDLDDSVVGDEIPPPSSPMVEIGLTGLKRASGYVQDEFLPQLSGRKAVETYREMVDNSAVAAAWVYTVTQLLRQIEWRVEPASNRGEDRANAEFVEQNMEDMEHSWGDLIGEVCSFLPYGWSVHELVYKKREGLWPSNPKNRSQFKDGKIGWGKMPIRGQQSLIRWKFAGNGDILAMVQMPAPTYQRIVLPMDRCLLFRTRMNKGNPEGYSLLRPMYRSWFMVKRFEEIEAVGVERDLAGLPIAKVPPKYLNPAPNTDEAKVLEAIKQAVLATRRNEQEGLIWPLDYNEDGKAPLWDFDLLTSGGSRQFDVGAIIQRYETRMLMSAMADFIMTGHEDSGASYALHTDKSGIFETGVNGLALAIADPINRKAIPDLFRYNGMRPERLPKLVPNNVNPPDLGQLAAFITATAGAGLPWFPDPELEKYLRDAARLPQLDKDIEHMREAEQRQAAILSLATQKLQVVQIEQQAQQGAMQLEGQAMGNAQQAQALEAGPEQGQKPDPNEAKRSDIAVKTDSVKLQQEKAKLATLKKPAPKTPVKKSMSAFGVDHEPVAG